MEYARIDRDVLVRHPDNPILTAKDFPIKMRAVYNSTAVKMEDGKYVMLCRSNQMNARTLLWGADSEDGIHFKLRPEPFEMSDDPEWLKASRSVYFDPRVTWIDGRYIVLLAVNGDYGSLVTRWESQDLQTLEYKGFMNVPSNRNMVIFPKKSADGRYMRLERPNDPGKGGKGDIWMSYSPDLVHWGEPHHVVGPNEQIWNYSITSIGPSTVPYRTDEGWLCIFHAIMGNATSLEYSVGALLLDLDEPWKVRHITKHPMLVPEAEYEMTGLVEHVCFPCGKIVEPDGTVKLYYGAADMVQCVATGTLKDIIFACKNW